MDKIVIRDLPGIVDIEAGYAVSDTMMADELQMLRDQIDKV